MDGDVCQRDAGCRIGRPAHLPLQCFKYEWTVLPFAQQQTEDDECLSGSKIREQVAHFLVDIHTYVHNHPELGITNMVDANRNDLSTMKYIIDMYTTMGLYKEE